MSSATSDPWRSAACGLALERAQLAADLAQEVLDAQQVRLGGVEPALGLLLALAELQDAGGLLDDRAALLGSGVEHRVDLALADDHVLLAADAGVGEQLLHVEQAARHAVDGVLAVAGAEQRAGDGDLGELDAEHAGGVVDGDADLGPPQRRALGGAGEDHVVHLLVRTALGAWAPSTHAMASTTLDLPDPLGPTTTVTPGSSSSVVLSANDLKPLRLRLFRNTAAAKLPARELPAHPHP